MLCCIFWEISTCMRSKKVLWLPLLTIFSLSTTKHTHIIVILFYNLKLKYLHSYEVACIYLIFTNLWKLRKIFETTHYCSRRGTLTKICSEDGLFRIECTSAFIVCENLKQKIFQIVSHMMVPEQQGQCVLELFRILHNAPIAMKSWNKRFSSAARPVCITLCRRDTSRRSYNL